MMPVSMSREIAAARSASGQELLRRDVHLTVSSNLEGGLEIRFGSPCERVDELERTVTALQSGLAARLPDALRSRLTSEAGYVRSIVSRADGKGEVDFRSYAMASWRGVVLGIGEADSAAAFPISWNGTVDAAEIGPGLPIVLGPSAVLTLISYALEVSGSHTGTEGFSRMPGLTVTDTAGSPYPPQDLPFGAGGAISRDCPLLREGEWCNRQEAVGGGVDPIFFLLTRPERALRPLAASSHFVRRNLAIRCSEKAQPLSPVVVVDSCKVRVGPRGGTVPVDAEVSLLDSQQAHLASVEPLRLDVDPWWVLGRVRGAWGPELPAIDEDPIEGDAYGLAPFLVMDLTVGDLL